MGKKASLLSALNFYFNPVIFFLSYNAEACKMAVHLAHDLLKNPPDLLSETGVPPSSIPATSSSSSAKKGSKKRRFTAASHQITNTASTTLAHCAFLCTVLAENAQAYQLHHLAFQVT